MKPIFLLTAAAAIVLYASPALAEMPGASCCGKSGCISPLTVGQMGVAISFYALSPDGSSCYTRQGAVVLLRDPSQDAHDSRNWTDVAIFYEPGAPWQGGYATDVVIISEENPAGGIGGIQDADLSIMGLTIANILAANTIYMPKDPSSLTEYDAVAPTWTQQYFLRSDPGLPVPSMPSTLGRVKAIYRSKSIQ